MLFSPENLHRMESRAGMRLLNISCLLCQYPQNTPYLMFPPEAPHAIPVRERATSSLQENLTIAQVASSYDETPELIWGVRDSLGIGN